MIYFKHLLFAALWVVMTFQMAGCKTAITKERAKDYLNDYIDYVNTADGGITIKNAQVTIEGVRYLSDSLVVIDYTWSGILKEPALANPKPDKTVSNEPGMLELRLKNGKWSFRDDD